MLEALFCSDELLAASIRLTYISADMWKSEYEIQTQNVAFIRSKGWIHGLVNITVQNKDQNSLELSLALINYVGQSPYSPIYYIYFPSEGT